jgi:molybdenum-dependent DNA-binding transcriptional regulator ModE
MRTTTTTKRATQAWRRPLVRVRAGRGGEGETSVVSQGPRMMEVG